MDSFPSSPSRVGEEEHHAVSIIPNPIKTPIGALQFLWSFRMHHLHGICPSTKHKWGFPFSCCCCLMQAMLPIRLACARYLAFPLATLWPSKPSTTQTSSSQHSLSGSLPVLRARRMARSFGDAPVGSSGKSSTFGISCSFSSWMFSSRNFNTWYFCFPHGYICVVCLFPFPTSFYEFLRFVVFPIFYHYLPSSWCPVFTRLFHFIRFYLIYENALPPFFFSCMVVLIEFSFL